MTATAKTGQNRIGLWIIGGAVVITAAIIVLIVLTSRPTVSGDSEAYADIPTEWINGTRLGNPDAPVVLEAYERFSLPPLRGLQSGGQGQIGRGFRGCRGCPVCLPVLPPGNVRSEFLCGCPGRTVRGRPCRISSGCTTIPSSLASVGLPAIPWKILPASPARWAYGKTTLWSVWAPWPRRKPLTSPWRTVIAAGVTGTPALLINGERYTGNAVDYDAIKTALNAALQP